MKNFLQTLGKLILLAVLSAGSINLFGQSLVSTTYRGKQPALMSYAGEDGRQEPGESVRLESVLKQLETDYKINFAYDGHLVSDKYVPFPNLKEVKGSKENVETILSQVLKPLALGYAKINEVYVIYKTDDQEVRPVERKRINYNSPENGSKENLGTLEKLSRLPASLQLSRLQEKTITGQVTDENDDALPGVNIVVKNTTTGTVSDMNGNYRLTVPDEANILVFSSVGYTTQEIEINGRTMINLQMTPDVQALSEIVVIGYGTQEKRDITGAVSSVEPAEFEDEPIANFSQGLQGKVAGVNVTSSSGAPGGNMIVRIRGNNSVIGSNDPLYVVDGVPIQSGTSGSTNLLSTINSGDIASIEVLKDASATAIYGSRGSNGVILITTKQGVEGKNLVEFETSFGFREVINKLDMMNSRQFAEIANERNINDGLPIIFNNIDTLTRVNTDWQEEVFRSGLIQNHTLRFSGGNDKTRYLVSGSYFDEEGIIVGSDFQRGSIRMNLDQEISAKFNLSGRLFASRSVNNEVNDDQILQNALNSPPFFPVTNPDGSYVNAATLKQFSFSPSSGDNAVAVAKEQLNERRFDRVLGNVTGSYSLWEDLTLNVLLGVDHLGSKQDFYNPRILEGGLPAGSGSKRFSSTTSFLNENTINYQKSLRNADQLNVTVGFTWQTEESEFLSGSSSGFVSDDLENNILGAGENFAPPSTGISEWTLISWLGRVNYSLNDKYLFTLSGRADGSSRFGAGNKWGFFPSGAVAWRISDENFIRDNISQISDLKLRLSYGISGNQAISPYQSLQRFSDVGLAFGGTPTTGFAAANLGNPDLRWETTEEFNAGLEIGLWEHRLRITADYYVKNTRDLLAQVNLPPTSGFTTNIQNIGSTRNKGFELQIGADLIRGENLNWDISVNGFRNVNEVTETADGQDIIAPTLDILGSANIVREGEPLSAFYGLKTDGLTSEGLYNFVDANGDGEINDDDRVILGSPYPDFVYGMTTNFTHGNFSLRVSLQGQLGKTVWNNNKYRHMNSFHRGSNQIEDVYFERWTEANPDPNAPYPKATSVLNQAPSDWFLEDASYLRVQNVRLGYTIPVDALNIPALTSASVYISAQNLFTFTDYSWYTPDVNNFASGDLRIGIDQRTYPAARTFMAGIKIGF